VQRQKRPADLPLTGGNRLELSRLCHATTPPNCITHTDAVAFRFPAGTGSVDFTELFERLFATSAISASF
jgi:hypothetical protein